MAAIRELCNVTWDETTVAPQHVVLDVSNEDCLMWQLIGPNSSYVLFEGSLDGINWPSVSGINGGDGWDAYNNYYSNGTPNELFAVPTFAAAPLKWLRFTLDVAPDPDTTINLIVSGGVIGR